MGVEDLQVIATAAARDAANGAEFVEAAKEAIGAPVTLLSGSREAELSALGVVSGVFEPDGVVGDLGGGSLELIDVKGSRLGRGTSLQLGGLTLMDASQRSPRAAARIVRDTLARSAILDKLQGRRLYAVGGTWRALAKLHMRQRNYPLRVMHGYAIPAHEAADFAGLVERSNTDTLISIDAINAGRRPLLAYGAVVLEEIIRKAHPVEVVISTAGVREGLLYEKLDEAERRLDPLLVAARELNQLMSRSPQHAEDLCEWSDGFMKSAYFDETPDERRLRQAACLLADINWRAHPDYRAEQSLNLITHASFTGVDHPGRCFLALTTAYRHLGLDGDVSQTIRGLVSSRMLDRARLVGAAQRVAALIAVTMPGILPRTPIVCVKNKIVLTLPQDLAELANDRLQNRLKQLARLIAREAAIVIG